MSPYPAKFSVAMNRSDLAEMISDNQTNLHFIISVTGPCTGQQSLELEIPLNHTIVTALIEIPKS